MHERIFDGSMTSRFVVALQLVATTLAPVGCFLNKQAPPPEPEPELNHKNLPLKLTTRPVAT
jgi:hypothetical protein